MARELPALVNDAGRRCGVRATPHPGHHDAALLAINAGKAVLVEKPFAMDAAQAREMIDAARDQGTFLMEAMWTRFLPHIARVREILAARTLGEWIDMQHPPHGNVLNCRDDGCMAGGHPAWWSGRGAVPLGPVYDHDLDEVEVLGWEEFIARQWEWTFAGYRSGIGLRRMCRRWSDLIEIGLGCSQDVADVLVRAEVIDRADRDLEGTADAQAVVSGMVGVLADRRADLLEMGAAEPELSVSLLE